VAIAMGSQLSVPQTLVSQRATYVSVVGAILVLRPPPDRGKPRWTPARVATAASTGLGDMIANLLYAITTRTGLLPVVSVLASLYPVATVLLANLIDRERLGHLQLTGVAVTFLGVALIGCA
jgi:drug/metabolite transporter (DMT)-like permease